MKNAEYVENLLTDFGFEYVTVSGHYIRYTFKGRNEMYYAACQVDTMTNCDIRHTISMIILKTIREVLEDVYNRADQ